MLLNPDTKILFIKFLLSNGKKRRLVTKRFKIVSPHCLLKDSVNPIYTDNRIINHVINVCWNLKLTKLVNTGIKNQKFEAPHKIEKGKSLSRGNSVLDLFSFKELLFQNDGVL